MPEINDLDKLSGAEKLALIAKLQSEVSGSTRRAQRTTSGRKRARQGQTTMSATLLHGSLPPRKEGETQRHAYIPFGYKLTGVVPLLKNANFSARVSDLQQTARQKLFVLTGRASL
jgi:hypothetical protein